MRILKFIVNGMSITKDPDCNFENIVSGTSGIIEAEFYFSQEWRGFTVAAEFYNVASSDKTFPAIIKNNKCMIPKEALTYDWFGVSVAGYRSGDIIKTNMVRVMQIRGGA